MPPQRMVFEVWLDVAPLAVENFVAIVCGDRGKGSESGVLMSYRGCAFHRIIKGFVAQGGDFVKNNGSGGESIWGKKFKDDPLGLKVHSFAWARRMILRGSRFDAFAQAGGGAGRRGRCAVSHHASLLGIRAQGAELCTSRKQGRPARLGAAAARPAVARPRWGLWRYAHRVPHRPLTRWAALLHRRYACKSNPSAPPHPCQVKLDARGLLAMGNSGKNSNKSHFFCPAALRTASQCHETPLCPLLPSVRSSWMRAVC